MVIPASLEELSVLHGLLNNSLFIAKHPGLYHLSRRVLYLQILKGHQTSSSKVSYTLANLLLPA